MNSMERTKDGNDQSGSPSRQGKEWRESARAVRSAVIDIPFSSLAISAFFASSAAASDAVNPSCDAFSASRRSSAARCLACISRIDWRISKTATGEEESQYKAERGDAGRKMDGRDNVPASISSPSPAAIASRAAPRRSSFLSASTTGP